MRSKDKKWQVAWPDGPVNVRAVKRGDAPSMNSNVSRVLKFGDVVDTIGSLVVDRDGNEWIRLKNSVGSSSSEWVCVRDRNGALLTCGYYQINSSNVKLWRSLFLRWHYRSAVSHPVVRCILREGRETNPL